MTDDGAAAEPESPKTGQVFSLVERRSPVTVTDNRKWTPVEVLRDLLKEIESGEVKPANMMIFFMHDEGGDGGNLRPMQWFQNVTLVERIAYLQLALVKTVDEWRGV